MSAKKVGTLIKEARTNAGLTQEQLARKVRNCSAADISRAERGEKELTQDQLKQIARATGVTQKSLLDAARGATGTSSSGRKTSTASRSSMQVTATERKLVELYRQASSDDKKTAMKVLRGNGANALVENMLGDALEAITGKK